MIRNTKSVLQSYADFYNAEMTKLEAKKEELSERYLDSYFVEEYKKVKDSFDLALKEKQDNVKNEIDKIFTAAKKAVEASTVKTVSSDFVNDIQILKDMSLTPQEMQLYFEKYKDNYLAVKTLNELAKAQKMPIHIVSLDEKFEQLNAFYTKCVQFINMYSGINKSYAHENLLRGTEIESVSALLNTYIVTDEQ